MSSSTPPEESTSHVHHHDSPNTPAGATHTVLSFLEQATSREGRPDSTASTVLGTAHNMLHRLTSSSSSTQHAHAHATPSPEALLDEAAVSAEAKVLGTAHNMLHRLTSSSPSTQHAHAHATPSPEAVLDETAVSATPTVLGAAQNAISRLTHAASHAIPHGTRAPQTQKPVPDLPQEHPAEAFAPTEGPQQRAADSTAQGHASRSVSSRGGGSGEGRAITPPPGVARVTRLYPAMPDPMHRPRPARGSHAHRRATGGTYAESETAWHLYDDKDPVRFVPR
jgi:hypothetical protein